MSVHNPYLKRISDHGIGSVADHHRDQYDLKTMALLEIAFQLSDLNDNVDTTRAQLKEYMNELIQTMPTRVGPWHIS